MSDKTRIGELLLLQERIDPWVLTNTLKEQASTRQRLISLLIYRAQLDPDEGAMVLSEQLGYPAAMQRHLERRDPRVTGLVPPQLGSAWVVLPLGYAKTGALIVVARDPTPILSAALEHIVRGTVMLSVTPCIQLERIVRATYGGSGQLEDPLPYSPPTISDIGNVRLEDETPLPIRRARTVSYMFEGQPQLPERTPQPVDRLEQVLSEIDKSITATGAERLVMAYVSTRWKSSLLAKVEQSIVIGTRGHGSGLEHPEYIRLSLTEDSMLSIAAGSRHATQDTPDTRTQRRLRAVLGSPSSLTAAPVVIGQRVDSVLVVGDPHGGASLHELDKLVDALGATCDRLSNT